jgi:GTP-binding protein
LPDDGSEWNVLKDDKAFVVTGRKIEQFAHRTDFTNEQAVQRLRDIMRRAGIMHELRRQGVEAGQIVQIGKSGEFTY